MFSYKTKSLGCGSVAVEHLPSMCGDLFLCGGDLSLATLRKIEGEEE